MSDDDLRVLDREQAMRHLKQPGWRVVAAYWDPMIRGSNAPRIVIAHERPSTEESRET